MREAYQGGHVGFDGGAAAATGAGAQAGAGLVSGYFLSAGVGRPIAISSFTA